MYRDSSYFTGPLCQANSSQLTGGVDATENCISASDSLLELLERIDALDWIFAL